MKHTYTHAAIAVLFLFLCISSLPSISTERILAASIDSIAATINVLEMGPDYNEQGVFQDNCAGNYCSSNGECAVGVYGPGCQCNEDFKGTHCIAADDYNSKNQEAGLLAG